MAPANAVERLIALHPGWTLHVFPGVGHHPFLRQLDAYLEFITAN